MSKKISQREARRLRKRVAELMTERATLQNWFANPPPGTVHLASLPLDKTTYAVLNTARKFGVLLVLKPDAVGHESAEIYGVR
jgi:hypothetical protein